MPMESEIPPPSSRSVSSGESASSCEGSKSSDESLHSSRTSELSIDEKDLVTGSSDTQPQSDSVDGDNVESTMSQLTATSVHSPHLDPTSVSAGYKTILTKQSSLDIWDLIHKLNLYIMYKVLPWKDRIDYSCFSEKLDNGEVNLYSVLPNSEDYQLLKQNFAIHIPRIIADYLLIFKEDFKNLVPRHIPHKYNEIQNCKMQLTRLEIFLPITGELLDKTKKYIILIPLVTRKHYFSRKVGQ